MAKNVKQWVSTYRTSGNKEQQSLQEEKRRSTTITQLTLLRFSGCDTGDAHRLNH